MEIVINNNPCYNHNFLDKHIIHNLKKHNNTNNILFNDLNLGKGLADLPKKMS